MVSDGIKAARIQAQYSPLINSTWPGLAFQASVLSAVRNATVIGQAWDTVVIAGNVPMAGPLAAVVGNGQAITTPAGPGTLITTNLVNVIVLDDGRVAVGAVTPEALAAAVPAS